MNNAQTPVMNAPFKSWYAVKNVNTVTDINRPPGMSAQAADIGATQYSVKTAQEYVQNYVVTIRRQVPIVAQGPPNTDFDKKITPKEGPSAFDSLCLP